MTSLIPLLQQIAKSTPDRKAIVGSSQTLTYGQLVKRIQWLSQTLRDKGVQRLAILADNGPEWALTDLAAYHLGIPCIPLPPFFSPSQLAHCLQDSQPDLIVTDRPDVFAALYPQLTYAEFPLYDIQTLTALRPNSLMTPPSLPEGTGKITYTSGTTGEPKGVCLSHSAITQVAMSLLRASAGHAGDRHLSILPLATLLENVAGLYTPLMAGATVYLLSRDELGGSSLATMAQQLTQLCHTHHVSTTILTPHLLQSWCQYLTQKPGSPRSLRFVAVGGAAVPLALLKQAREQLLPVFEGYGLSECASVVSLNTPQAHQLGCVGKPLPHLAVRLADDGEILVQGNLFLGYLGKGTLKQEEWFETGDLGDWDADGFLHIRGRKKNIFITSQGRNISPEWLEKTLLDQPEIAQVAVFGEGLPQPIAVIIAAPSESHLTDTKDALAHAVQRANLTLPNYARIARWVAGTTPFTPQNGLLTANGRVRRDSIQAHYAEPLAHSTLAQEILSHVA